MSSTPIRLRAGGAMPPAAVNNLTVAASTTQAKSIIISWTEPTGSVYPTNLTGYKIYRGGNLISTQTGTTYTDTGLSYTTTYSYTVKAYNLNGDGPGSSGSATTGAACTPVSSKIEGTTGVTNKSSTTLNVTVPTGCFKVRIRALSGGGGGLNTGTYTHLGSCYGPYMGGGGGGYVDAYTTATPGSTITMEAGNGGYSGYTGGRSGAFNGGSPLIWVSAGMGGMDGGGGGGSSYAAPNGTITTGTNGTTSSGGGAALPGTNPTGFYLHASNRIQTCGNCSGCTGQAAANYGGGGAPGTDSGALWGESGYQGGNGSQGYVVWDITES